MENYYVLLGVEPTADWTVIESAYDNMYNKWRQLVNHHVPETVIQANQKLLQLQQARAVLADPSKRQAYDQELGLAGAVGGIADPEAPAPTGPSIVFPTPPPPAATSASQTAARQSSVERVDAWICPKCSTANPVETRFCKSCGQALSQECPNCGGVAEATAKFCPKCGINIQVSLEETRIKQQMEAQRLAEIQRIEMENAAALAPLTKMSDSAWSMTRLGCILAFIPWINIISLVLWAISAFRARQVMASAQVPGDTRLRSNANKAFIWSGIPLALGSVIVVVLIISYLGSL